MRSTHLILLVLVACLSWLKPALGLIAGGRARRSWLSMEASPYKNARAANAPGNLYVDESCIDCDVCRWMCPGTYSRKGIKSIVHTQPQDEDAKLQAYAAMISCPVGSIRLRASDPLVKVAPDLLPALIDEDRLPGIMHMGYHASSSFGATPYLIARRGGNVMIDCPRYNERLAANVEAEGGVALLLLTHKDDVSDHERWKKRFPNLKRVIHRADVVGSALTELCEVQLSGEGRWEVAEDVSIIHTPGHTAGSLSIIVRTERETALFTGDHLSFSHKSQRLDGFKRFNHGNVAVQGDSIRLLAATDPDMAFQWILPGHGRMVRFRDDEERVRAVLEAAADFEKEEEMDGMFAVGYN